LIAMEQTMWTEFSLHCSAVEPPALIYRRVFPINFSLSNSLIAALFWHPTVCVAVITKLGWVIVKTAIGKICWWLIVAIGNSS
jgi:hypothetical protein